MGMYGWKIVRNLLLDLLIKYNNTDDWSRIVEVVQGAILGELTEDELITIYNEYADRNRYEVFYPMGCLDEDYNKDNKELYEIVRDFADFDFNAEYYLWDVYGPTSYTTSNAADYIINYYKSELCDYIWDYQPSLISDFAEYIDFINEYQEETITDEIIEEFKNQCF